VARRWGKRRRAGRRLSSPGRRLADALGLVVLAVQAATLVVFAVDPMPGWADRPVPAEFWALGRRWQFHLLLVALLAAPVLSIVAWRLGARWRWLVAASWPVFLLLLITLHERQLRIMLELIRRHA